MTSHPQHAELALDEKDIVQYLQNHPDFLVRYPDLITKLSLPARPFGEGVSDFQSFMVQRLKMQVQALRDSQHSLITAGHENDISLTRLHATALRLMEARSLEELGHIVQKDIPSLCSIDCAQLALENTKTPPSILSLPDSTIESWLGPADAMLCAHAKPMPELLGQHSAAIRSVALVRLEIGKKSGLLSFGSNDPEWFHPDQGTDFIAFLGGIVVRIIHHFDHEGAHTL